MRTARKVLCTSMCLAFLAPAQDFGYISGVLHKNDSSYQGSASARLDSLDLDLDVSGGVLKARVAAVLTMPDTVHTFRLRPHKQQTCADTSPGSDCMEYFGYDTTWVDRTKDTLDVRLRMPIPMDGIYTGVSVREQGREIRGRIVPIGGPRKWGREDEFAPTSLFRMSEGQQQESVDLEGLRFRLGETKRIQLEWIQAIHEDMVLPIAASLRLPSLYSVIRDTGRIGHIRIATKADVESGLILDLGDRGTMPIGTSPATRTWTNPGGFVFRVKGLSPSVWVASDGAKGAFGSHVVLRGSAIKFQDVSSRHLIILDFASASASRAKKLALLALLEYGQSGKKANLAWRTDAGISRLWKDYVELDAERGSEALAFLKAWNPTVASSPLATLSKFADSDSGATLILVSSEAASSIFRPDGKLYDSSNPEIQSAARKWNALAARLEAAGHTLFGWWSNKNLDWVAWQTKGFSFEGIEFPQGSWSRDGMNQVCTYTPILFGPERPGRERPTNIRVQVEGLDFDSLAYFPMDYSWNPGRNLFYTVFNGLLRTASTTTTDDSLTFMVAGRYKRGGAAKIVLSGVWNAQPFTGTVNVDVPDPPASAFGNQIWAKAYAQMLMTQAPVCEAATWSQLLRLGLIYQLPMAATALVGAPSGVALPDSLPSIYYACDSFRIASTTNNLAYRPNFQCSRFMPNLDTTSLDDLLLGRITSVQKSTVAAQVGLKIRSGSLVNLEVLGHDDGAATVRIVDLNGREVAKIAMTRSGEVLTASWKPTGRGVFFAVAEGARWKHTTRFTVGR